jgi:hypothetical protein
MSATTAPPEDKVAGAAADATESFIKVIGRKIRAGATRTKLFAIRVWTGGRRNTARGAKASWHGIKVAARWVAFGVTWVLMAIGLAVYTIFRWLGIVVIKLLDLLLLVIVAVLTGVAFVLEYAVYFVVRVALFVGLLLGSLYFLLRDGKTAVKTDWELFWVGLKPRNWKYMTLGTIAEMVVTSKAAPPRRTAESNGRGSRPAAATRTARNQAGKGRPTPRRSTRRSSKLPGARVRGAATA